MERAAHPLWMKSIRAGSECGGNIGATQITLSCGTFPRAIAVGQTVDGRLQRSLTVA
jgi:hypothetical protein